MVVAGCGSVVGSAVAPVMMIWADRDRDRAVEEAPWRRIWVSTPGRCLTLSAAWTAARGIVTRRPVRPSRAIAPLPKRWAIAHPS